MYKSIISIPRFWKQSIIILADIKIAIFSLYLSIGLRMESLTSEMTIATFYESSLILYFLPIIVLASNKISKLNKLVLRSFNLEDIYKLLNYSIVMGGFLVIIIFVGSIKIPRSISLLFPVLFFINATALRLILLSTLNKIRFKEKILHKKIVIYGAGNTGRVLYNNIGILSEFEVIAFIDDNLNLNNVTISNKNVFSKKEFKKSKISKLVDEIWIATPSATDLQKKEIFKFASSISKKIRLTPSFNEILRVNDISKSLIDINFEDLVDRKKIEIPIDFYNGVYDQTNVLVTGSGGSIGSELCRQISNLNVSSIVLFEQSELGLYNIERELNEYANKRNIKIIPILGSILDTQTLKYVIKNYNIDVVLHAAAYKHVPLVEANPIEGFKNNVYGTIKLINCCLEYNIERFVLVSTDKAVRPTNMMGASKRISEIIVQHFAKTNLNISFAIVRFGNVLGSSGSVIPLFKEQIAKGGPITITDINMTRYFMSIKEASQLILLSGSYNSNGEIYILEMGLPIKIIDLAKNIITTSGFTIKDSLNPDGQIEIKVTNIRPGEKIHEELFYGDNLLPTNHEKVNIAGDNFPNDFDFNKFYTEIQFIIESNDKIKLYEYISSSFKEFKIKLK